jgi:phosphoglycolate phosphatase-like HAD superfamily hydrolase
MHKHLILWDIDGTILRSAGAGMKALNTALQAVFGLSGSFAGIDFAGRTDLWIIRQIFARFGIEDNPENRAAYIEGYITALPAILRSCDSGVLPGVREILVRAADHPDVVQGLLTGNLRRGAEAKLGFHGLYEYFPIGAFADDSEVRNELGPHALRRARQHWGVDFPPGQVWIVGDTPHDILCARACGARVLAVATGGSSVAELTRYNPDAIFEHLGDPSVFWRTLGV